jgi:hypothetical protein
MNDSKVRQNRTLEVKPCCQHQRRSPHKRTLSADPNESTLMAVDLSSEPQFATLLRDRGGRSMRECGLATGQGHTIEDFAPRAQQLKDARTREVLRLLDLEADLAAMRPQTTKPAIAQTKAATPQPRRVSPRAVTNPAKRFLDALLEGDPAISCPAFCQKIDAAIHHARTGSKHDRLMPPQSWIDATNDRTWVGLHHHRKTKKLVQAFFDKRKAAWRRQSKRGGDQLTTI